MKPKVSSKAEKLNGQIVVGSFFHLLVSLEIRAKLVCEKQII